MLQYSCIISDRRAYWAVPSEFFFNCTKFTSNTGHSSTSGRIFFVAAFCKLVHAVTAPEIGSPHLSVTPVESLLLQFWLISKFLVTCALLVIDSVTESNGSYMPPNVVLGCVANVRLRVMMVGDTVWLWQWMTTNDGGVYCNILGLSVWRVVTTEHVYVYAHDCAPRFYLQKHTPMMRSRYL
jgi:hypothetical protein